jgi:hypothetical protein
MQMVLSRLWALGRYRDTSTSGQHGGGDDGFTGRGSDGVVSLFQRLPLAFNVAASVSSRPPAVLGYVLRISE